VIVILVLVGLLAVVSLTAWALWSGQSRPARVARQLPEWVTNTARTVRTGAIVVLALVAVGLAYQRGLTVYDDITARRRQAAQDKLTLEHVKTQNELNAVRVIKPDEKGRLGVSYDGKSYRDMDYLTVYSQMETVYLVPIMEQLRAIRGLLEAGGGWPAAAAQERLLDAGQGPAVQLLPSTLDGLLSKYSFRPSLHNILIGEYVDSGTVKPLTLSIPQAVHVLCTGASGQGKSTLLEAMALQLAGLDGVQLAAIDYGSGTFDALEDALRWQIADTPELAIALLRELLKVCQERKERYKAVGRVRSLDQYNAMAGENLPFIAAFADETSALLDHDGTKAPFVELARTGRKYGVGLILGGTDFKATTLPSEARSNCQARIAFWLERGLSQSLLDCNDASELGNHEIAVKRPGIVGTVRGLPPNVTEASYRVLPLRRREVLTLDAVPVASEPSGNGKTRLVDDPDNIAQVLELHAAGESDTAIASKVFKHGTVFYIDRVREILEQHNNSHESENDKTPQNGGSETGLRYAVDAVGAVADVDWCEHCNRDADSVPSGVTFSTCPGCGVAICSDCLADAGGTHCPDCRDSKGA